MENYSVKKLSDVAGVSVRTLHLYDEMGLLKPSVRTAAGYRLYGEKELLRLQQILFYKQLGFALQDIVTILDQPDFDVVNALKNHRALLLEQRSKLTTLLNTIDKTIDKLKNHTNMNIEELYEGLPKEKAEEWRKEAMEKYGSKTVERAETSLRNMGKDDFARLKEESMRVTLKLLSLIDEDPFCNLVQEEIARHYVVIRKFWGTHGTADKQREAYAGLGELYVNDERYTMMDGKPNPKFARFMQQAMAHYANTILR